MIAGRCSFWAMFEDTAACAFGGGANPFRAERPGEGRGAREAAISGLWVRCGPTRLRKAKIEELVLGDALNFVMYIEEI